MFKFVYSYLVGSLNEHETAFVVPLQVKAANN